MAYKRQIDRLPIIPKDAKEFNVTCHYCIVGCGYKAYTWAVNKQGGAAADQNKFGVDLAKQQPAKTAAWYSPSMYNIVRQNGEDVHIVIKPDKDCEVNSGLGSVRGARMAEMSYSRARNTELQRLTDPMVWRYGQMQPTSWDDALDLVARVTVAVINDMGEDGLFVSAFDHGGAGGGYENTWGTGKLYFGAMKVKNIRIHNRPAYNSEVHATRDMGVGELNNCYEDAELADTIVAVGTNALETQTNYFLNHWVPNLRGTSVDKKRAEFGSEPVGAGTHRHRRSAAHRDGQRLRGRSRQGPRDASRDQLGHRSRPVQRLADLHRGEGLDRQGVHRRLDQGLRQGLGCQQDEPRRGGADHRLDGRPDPPVGRVDRAAQSGRRPAAHHVRLREGPDLGQRQLSHQRRARERRAGDRQCRPSRRRLRAHGRAPGRLFTALRRPCRPAGRLCRQAADRGQGRRAPHLGLRPLQDHAERAEVQAGLQEAHRHGEGRHVGRALRRSQRDWSMPSSARSRTADCSPSTSTSCRPRSAKPATSGCRRRPRAKRTSPR